MQRPAIQAETRLNQAAETSAVPAVQSRGRCSGQKENSRTMRLERTGQLPRCPHDRMHSGSEEARHSHRHWCRPVRSQRRPGRQEDEGREIIELSCKIPYYCIGSVLSTIWTPCC